MTTTPRHPETLVASAQYDASAAVRAVIPPIHPSANYARNAQYELNDDRDYSRDRNPTPELPERVLAELEHGSQAMLFSTGMAAATAVFRALTKPGDHVVAPLAMYFNLRKWLRAFSAQWNVEVSFVDMTKLDDLAAALRPGKTKVVWLESPANPSWDITDIAAASKLARKVGAFVCVDSTCATPVHTRPLELGAHLVMHSATKYLNGHSDVLAGALVVGELTGDVATAWAALRTHRHDDGAILGPFDAWLLLRGMRTLFVRVQRQSATALELATRLSTLPGIIVRYPGLPSHPGHAIAAAQMRDGFGGMLSLHTGGGAARAMQVASRLQVFVRATSLGGVESLAEHRLTAEGAASTAPADLLRLSIGLEHVDDLWRDLSQALAP